MNLQKFTQKSLEAVQSAQGMSQSNHSPQIETEHLLLALLEQPDGLCGELLTRAGVDVSALTARVRDAIARLPQAGGSGYDPEKVYISRDLEAALNEAEAQAAKMGDEYVSVEHLLLGLMEKPSAALKTIFVEANVDKKAFLEAVKSARGGRKVTTDNPEATYDVLGKYGQDLVELARAQKLDPVIGRDEEIRRVIRILSRKSKNNPCLIGEPGVGKT
ncbi:MAG: type VI secretion system ATPase TssH, partial [Clostridia bacterium]|nr:type VI secretion system ATPase TssH [Clostridia bacterium]